MKERIQLDMNMVEVVVTMSEGDLRVAPICADALRHGKFIDPDNAFEGFGALLDLDTHGIYGSRIYMLWNDVCKRNLAHMLAVLRADQMGQLAGCSDRVIQHAIDNHGEGLDLPAVLVAVKEALPNFNIDYTY